MDQQRFACIDKRFYFKMRGLAQYLSQLFLKLPEELKMAVAIFFVCMFLLTGLIIVMDDAQWDRKK